MTPNIGSVYSGYVPPLGCMANSIGASLFSQNKLPHKPGRYGERVGREIVVRRGTRFPTFFKSLILEV
jgi:hypothetical protein